MIFEYPPRDTQITLDIPTQDKGKLVITKYWHLKQKRVISVPGILVSKQLDVDDQTCVIFSILIVEPNSNQIIITTTVNKPEFVSCL